jgi:Nucleotidyl transferase AbiEii toxin, Type IV TA system
MIPHRLYLALALADAQPAAERRMRAAGLVCLSAAAGPTLAPEEPAGRKLLALFDRAAARDFADVRLLARRFGKDVLLARAAQIDPGFDIGTLAGMIATLDRFADDDIPVPEGSSVAELRAFYAEWRSELMELMELDEG